MLDRKSVFDRVIGLPFGLGSPFFVTCLIFAFVLLTSVHIGSFLYNCVWFYKPGINTCQNHRPLPVKKDAEPIELKVVKPVPTVTTTPAKIESAVQPTQREYATVGKISVDSNLRTGPGMGYPIMSVLYEGSTVEILETRDGWHHIKIIQKSFSEEDPTTGWVWSNLVE